MEPYFGWKNVSKIAIKKIKNTIREKKIENRINFCEQ